MLAEQDKALCSYAFSDEGERVRLKVDYCERHPSHHRYLAELLDVSRNASSR